MAKLVTVVLPIYNGEKYLERAVESVINQTFGIDKIKLIAINDGGTDNSSSIMKKYVQNFPDSIVFIDRENKGVAETRNEAITISNTKYITFIDQDDYLDLDFIEVLYKEAQRKNSEVVSSGFRRPTIEGKTVQRVQPKKAEYSKYILMAAWAKLHSTAFLKENDIKFFNNQFGEDHVFTVKEIVYAKKWSIVEYTGYNWFYNELSESNTKQKGLDTKDNFDRVLLKDFENVNATNNLDAYFNYFILRTTIGYLLFSGKAASSKRFLEVYRNLFSLLNEEQSFSFRIKYLLWGPKGETLIARISIVFFMIFHKTNSMKLFAKIYCNGS